MVAVPSHLSIVRPGEPPKAAPRGRAARELEWAWTYEHPGYGATPRQVLEIFRIAEGGDPRMQCDLFDDLIEADATLRNLFEQREGAIAGKDWSIEPDGAEGDSALAADVLEEALRKLPLADAFAHQLSAGRYGYAATEIDWGEVERDGRRWVVPVWFANIEPQRFKIDRKTDELLIVNDGQPNGDRLAPGKWWVTRMASRRVARAGLMRTAAPLALYKRYGTRDWVVYSEKFGLPSLIVRVPENASANAKAAARRLIERFGSDGGALLEEPVDAQDSIKVEVKETTSADSSSTHGSLITYCNREMSKLINGSTLTSSSEDSGGASYALGTVHESTRWETVQREDSRLRGTFTTDVAAMFVHFNELAIRPPRLRIQVVRDMEPKDQLENAERAKQMGLRISESQVRGFTGFYAPIGDDDELGGEKQSARGTPAPSPEGDQEAPKPIGVEPDPAEPSPDDPPKDPAEQAPEQKPGDEESAALSEAKLFQYHLPFVTVNEVRELWLGRPPVEGGDQYASEWAAEHAGGDSKPADPEEPAPPAEEEP